MILTVSCLASSAVSTGNDCTAFSTLASMSSIGMDRGVTAKLRPFCSSEETPSSNFWSLRLITVSFEVFETGCCALCNRVNLLSCLALLSSPMREAFLNVSWSIRIQSGSESTLAKRRCVFRRSSDVLSSYRLFCCILSWSNARLVRW